MQGEKLTALTPAERQAERRAKKAARGLVKVEVWVPADQVAKVKALEKKLTKGVE